MARERVRRSSQGAVDGSPSGVVTPPDKLEPAAAPRAPSAWASWRLTVLPAALIALAALAAYHNSFEGPFLYDDLSSIVENQTIRQLWPPRVVLSPPRDGETVSGRPLLNLSFALNYAMGGLDVRGYHAVNLAIHIAAALVLFGILRRTFLTTPLRDRFGGAALPLALAAALLWVVHPLQTASVTYIVRRAESMMGLFYLLTLYCVIRGAGSAGVPPAEAYAGETPAIRRLPPVPQRRRSPFPFLWYAAASVASLLGMATKEVMVTVPLMVLLYDRTFLTGSFRQALRRRFALYMSLAVTWGLLAYLVSSTGLMARRAEMASDIWTYARAQPGVILNYLRLSIWPHPLCFDYAWPTTADVRDILPQATALGLLLAVTIWGIRRQWTWSFLGAWLLTILAPTSSLMPLQQLAFEHRMYLSLAAVPVAVVAVVYLLWDKCLPAPPNSGRRRTGLRWVAPMGAWSAALLALMSATIVRNSDYQTSLAIWQDTVNKRPENPLAHYNLASMLDTAGRTGEAIAQYRAAVRLEPEYVSAHNNLGIALHAAGRSEEAIAHYREALRLKPDHAELHNNLAAALTSLGKTDEAIEHCHEALRLEPDNATAYNNLGFALARAGKFGEAIADYEQALRLKPEVSEVHYNLGVALARLGRTEEAIAQYRTALRLKPADADARNNLGVSLALAGRTEEAIEILQEVVRMKSNSAVAEYNLARALASVGRNDEAIEHYQQALGAKPDFALARHDLARALVAAGRNVEAMDHYNHLLQLMPESIDVLNDFAWLLATHESADGGNAVQAVQLAQRARELGGQENAQCLDTLAAAYAAAGRFDDAVITAERAIQLAESAGQTALVKNIQSRLELYRAGRPYREVPRSPGPTKP